MPFDGNDHAMQAVGILRYARAQIAAGNWVRGDYNHGHGRFCALGWVYQADDSRAGPATHEALRALRNAVPAGQRVGPLAQTIIDYNDSHQRHAVVRWFDRAIAALEQQA